MTSSAPTPDAPTSRAPTPDAPTSRAPTPDAPTSDAPTPDAPTSSAPTPEAPTSKARQRCSWVGAVDDYIAYHDDEWGAPLHGERELFERLTLEGFQSGLSWLVILRKRPAFRAAFANFDIDAIAGFTPAQVDTLLADCSIVRNRAKIEATVGNARAVRDNVEDLDALLWSFAPPAAPPYEVRATAPESVAMSKELKRRGFRFVGPTTCYSLMQAVGMVNDHQPGCWRADPARALSAR